MSFLIMRHVVETAAQRGRLRSEDVASAWPAQRDASVSPAVTLRQLLSVCLSLPSP